MPSLVYVEEYKMRNGYDNDGHTSIQKRFDADELNIKSNKLNSLHLNYLISCLVKIGPGVLEN